MACVIYIVQCSAAAGTLGVLDEDKRETWHLYESRPWSLRKTTMVTDGGLCFMFDYPYHEKPQQTILNVWEHLPHAHTVHE